MNSSWPQRRTDSVTTGDSAPKNLRLNIEPHGCPTEVHDILTTTTGAVELSSTLARQSQHSGKRGCVIHHPLQSTARCRLDLSAHKFFRRLLSGSTGPVLAEASASSARGSKSMSSPTRWFNGSSRFPDDSFWARREPEIHHNKQCLGKDKSIR